MNTINGHNLISWGFQPGPHFKDMIEEANRLSAGGAGRNVSRTRHVKRIMTERGDHRGLSPNAISSIMERETRGLDVRFYTGKPDISELPSAYKNADQVQSQIEKFGLARISDRVLPRGTIMAGEMNWNRNRAA